MKRKAYSKSILREIKSSKARFISILVIILLGVAFYSGIKASGPNMKAAIENFYNEYHLMDAKIVSTAGLSEEDLKLLDNSDKILDYYASHTVDANLTNINSVVKFMEYDQDKSANINSLEVVKDSKKSAILSSYSLSSKSNNLHTSLNKSAVFIVFLFSFKYISAILV